MQELAQKTPKAFDAFMLWIGDGEERGRNAEYVLNGGYTMIARVDEEQAINLLAMPFLNEVDSNETLVTSLLGGLAQWNKDELDWILAHPSLRGGVTDAHAAQVFLLRLELRDPAAASAIRRLSWVQDGITREIRREDSVVIDLVEIAISLPQTFDMLLERSWVQSRDNLVSDHILTRPFSAAARQ